MLSTDIGRVRLASILDGITWVVLAGVCVPLKHLGGNDVGVKIVGPIHGAFFIGLCIALWVVLMRGKLSFKWCVITFICALIPFAPFFLDKKLMAFEPD